MPRSASSQDGVALSLSPAPMSQLLLNDNSHLTVQQAQQGVSCLKSFLNYAEVLKDVKNT
jgi:hypothetical protein